MTKWFRYFEDDRIAEAYLLLSVLSLFVAVLVVRFTWDNLTQEARQEELEKQAAHDRERIRQLEAQLTAQRNTH